MHDTVTSQLQKIGVAIDPGQFDPAIQSGLKQPAQTGPAATTHIQYPQGGMTAQGGLEQGADIAIQATLIKRVFGVEILGKRNAHRQAISSAEPGATGYSKHTSIGRPVMVVLP